MLRSLFVLGLLLVLFAFMESGRSTNKYLYESKYHGFTDLKQAPYIAPYTEAIPEVRYENLTMIGIEKRLGVSGERMLGSVLRSLRYKNITDAVERRYNLPENLLLAIVIQESGGIDLLPNGQNDGGLGLCHMQPSTAAWFGLKIYQDCNELSSEKHGLALRDLIKRFRADKSTLIQFDDRFHPLKNLDAAGRMLAHFMTNDLIRANPIENTILHYSGAENFEIYSARIAENMHWLSDSTILDMVRKRFNELNPNLRINRHPANFDDYIASEQQLNLNYGLAAYQKQTEQLLTRWD